MCTAPTTSTTIWSMNSGPASPGNREMRSARRIRVLRVGVLRVRAPGAWPPGASLPQPQLHAVEQAPQPEFEFVRGGSRRQLLGQPDQMRVLLGWQRAVKVAQRQALRCAKAAAAEIVHRFLQNRGQDLVGHCRIDVSCEGLIEAPLPQNAERQ